MSQKIVSMIFFTDCLAPFFFTWGSLCFHFMYWLLAQTMCVCVWGGRKFIYIYIYIYTHKIWCKSFRPPAHTIPCKSFRLPHINQSRYSVLKWKNVFKENLLYNIMFISKSYWTLLIFHVASLSLNNCFSVPGKYVYTSFSILMAWDAILCGWAPRTLQSFSTHTHTHTHTRVCIYIYIYIYIHTHTHIHTSLSIYIYILIYKFSFVSEVYICYQLRKTYSISVKGSFKEEWILFVLPK